MQGASPLASPGAGRGAALDRRALAVPSGGVPSWSLVRPATMISGGGVPSWSPLRPCRYGAQRGACPLGRRFALPLWCPAGGLPSWSPARPAAAVPGGGGLPSLSPAYPAFSLLSRPHPPDPLPGGKGEIFSFLMQGASPLASPGWAGRGAALNRRALAVPRGGRALLVAGSPLPPRYPVGSLPSLSPAYPAFSLFVCPHPPTPLPSGKGEIFSFFMQGASPLASPGAGRGAALARLALAVPRGRLAFLVAGSPCHYGTRRRQIRQAHEKCRLIKIPRGGHTDATAQCGDSRLSCRQCLPRRNRNRVRKQKKHRRNRGD